MIPVYELRSDFMRNKEPFDYIIDMIDSDAKAEDTRTAAIEAITYFDLDTLIQEKVIVMYQNNASKIIGYTVAGVGSSKNCVVPGREILILGLLINATNLIVIHNHPSGDPSPSEEDIIMSVQMEKACNSVGIILNDCIITGASSAYSLKDMDEVLL